MAITDRKITDSAEHYRNVSAQVGTRLTGTVAQNKAVFDDYPELIANRFNAVIDDLVAVTDGSSGADNVGATAILGVTGATVQSIMEDLKAQLNTAIADAYTKAQADALFETIANGNLLVKTITYNSANGTFTITTQGGTVTTIDTDIEKVPASMSIVQVGGDYYLRITNQDGTYTQCSIQSFFNPVTFQNTGDITFNVTTNNGAQTVSADIADGSVDEAKLDLTYRQTLQGLVDLAEAARDDAQTAATNAGNSATSASGYANNASGYATNASNSATAAQGYATDIEDLTVSSTTLPAGSSATVTKTHPTGQPYNLAFGIPKGDMGATGNGISSITKTGTVGKVDTYTITFTNGSTTIFTVTNGLDGQGSVDSVNGQTGVVVLDADDILDTSTTNKWATQTVLDNSHNHNNLNFLNGLSQSTLDAKADKSDLGTISLSATWTGSASPYTQTVTVVGATVTSNSKVDIQPSATMLAQLIDDGCNAMYIENNNGTLTVYAIGEHPSVALSDVQVLVTEVAL